MYIQKLEKINQRFKQINSLSSLNCEELIKNLKLEGETERATYLDGVLNDLNSEMDKVNQSLESITLFMSNLGGKKHEK